MAATRDLFTTVHKGLRAMMADLNRRLQTNDFADLVATKALVADLEFDFDIARSAGCAICIMSGHASHEETHIFGDAARLGNTLVPTLIQEHHGFTEREHAIAAAANEILKIPDAPGRVAAGARLNQSANALFAAYLTHMNKEEAELVPWMREHYTDAQMDAMQGAIIAGWAPDRVMAILGWMLPSMNRAELTGLLRGMQHSMPPPAFQGITTLAAAKIDPARWSAVRSEIGL